MAKKKGIVNTDLTVNHRASYEYICHNVGNHAFGPAFSQNLIEELSKYHSQKEIVSILKSSAKCATIINKETFFSTYKTGVGDIGHEAWRNNSTDIVDFTTRVLLLMELHKQRGESTIDLSSVLFYLSTFGGRRDYNPDFKWKHFLAIKMIAAASICSRYNPYLIQVVHPQLCAEVAEKLGIPNTSLYRSTISTFIEEYDKVYDSDTCKGRVPTITFPKIKFIIPVERNLKKSQIIMLARIFALNMDEAFQTFRGIDCLTEPSEELFSTFDRIKEKKALYDINNREVLRKIKKLDEKGAYLAYPKMKDYHRYFCYSNNSTLSLAAFKRYGVQDSFIDRESFLRDPFNDPAKIEVNCDNLLSISQIEPYADSAAKLLMSKVRKVGINKTSPFYGIENPKLLIQLTNVSQYNAHFVQEVRELEKKIRDTYMQNFQIQVEFSEATARSKFGEGEAKYVRVISDIHADVNKDRNYKFDFGSDFVINCGDTASNVHEERSWIRTYMQSGVVVPGNHLGYTSDKPELNGDAWSKMRFDSDVHVTNTFNAQIESLIDLFPQSGGVRYLSNGIIEYDGMIIIGNTLYTDFKLFGEENQAACMIEAARKMNDFRLRYSLERNGEGWHVIPFSVERHLKLFKVCKGYIMNRLKYLRNHNISKPVIIVTHHCPLPMCISEEYKNSPLSAAFASDMTDLLEKYPNIRLWCSGHVHAPYDFIYNQTRFVAEPWGYFNENGLDEENYGNRILISDIKCTTRSWRTLLKEEIKMGIVKDYNFSPNFTGKGYRGPLKEM